MTLMGKIFTLLIFVLSILFMCFALMTFVTHKNWREFVLREGGLKQQIETERQLNKTLDTQFQTLRERHAHEVAARQQALAVLNTKLLQTATELQAVQQQLTDKSAQHGVALAELNAANAKLDQLTKDIATLQVDLRKLNVDRDTQFASVVKLTDDIHKTKGDVTRLEERNASLVAVHTSLVRVASALGFNENTNVERVPPKIDGLVEAVDPSSKVVVITLGADDGLLVGHELEVFSRDKQYRGRIILKDVRPDRAVGEVLKQFERGRIERGDRVATKLS